MLVKIYKITIVLIIAALAGELTCRVVTRRNFTAALNRYPEVAKRYEGSIKMYDRAPRVFNYADPANRLLPIVKPSKSGRLPGESDSLLLVKTKDIKKEHLAFPDFDDRKRKGAFRILCVGGSTTWRGYVEDLAKIIKNKICDGCVEVLNFGFQAASIRETEYLLRNKYLKYSPDMIIVYHGFNDIIVASPLGKKPGANVFDALEQTSYGLFELALKGWKTGFAPPAGYMSEYKANILSNGTYYKNLISFCEKNKIDVVLSTFAEPDYANLPENERGYYDSLIRFMFPQLIDAAAYSELLATHNRMVKRIAKENNIEVVPVFERLKGGRRVFHDNCHLTDSAKKDQAAIFYNAIRKKLVEKTVALQQSSADGRAVRKR